jgi:hypothetical protein
VLRDIKFFSCLVEVAMMGNGGQWLALAQAFL